MVYLLKYLKYKNKYLNLKNQHGGATFIISKEKFKEYLTSKGITNFNDTLPTSILESHKFLSDLNCFTWNDIIKIGYEFESLKQSLEKYFNTVPHVSSGSTFMMPKEMIIEYLISKGITNFDDIIPTSILESNPALKYWEYFKWSNIINHKWLRYDFNNFKGSLEKYFNTVSMIPEIIKPTENLNFLVEDIDDFDLSRMTADRNVKSGPRKYQFEMTHLLFEELPFTKNGYALSALYYYTPDDINKMNIIEILTKYYKYQMFRRQMMGFDDNDEKAKRLKIKFGNKLEILSKSDFLTTPKYIRVGYLYFQKVDPTSITILDIDAWIMKAGSGLQMICSLLKIFLPEYNKIFLKPATFEVQDYWEKLGFKPTTGRESHVNTDISNTILSKCKPLASNIKLIIKSSKGDYITDLEEVKASIKE
jgi:hypothetical protein